MSNRQPINYSQYRERYNQTCHTWRSEPVSDRKLNDPICIGVLILLILTFFIVGGYYISQYNSSTIYKSTEDDLTLSLFKGQIIACMVFSIFVSMGYILLIKIAPYAMVMTMIVLSLILIAALCIIGIVIGSVALAVSMGVTLLIYGCILACFKDKIKMGITLVKVATKFISDRPIVFAAPILKTVLTFAFAIFWVFGMASIIYTSDQQSRKGDSQTAANILAGVWVLLLLFFTFFFYYIMVFSTAVICAFWYYNVQGKNPLVVSYKWFFKSAIGSITFAALLISIVTMARMIIDSKRSSTKNIAVAVCLAIMACIMRQIEALLKILNHNSIICMAVTGEGFIDSAKTAIGIICSDFPLFSVARLITNLLVFWGIILSVGIPSIIGYIWVNSKQYGSHYAGNVILLIICGSVMISGMIYSILVESISSVFIFYCFDRRFQELGFESRNMPLQINQALGNAEIQARLSYGKLQE